jgi:hypothetical protein
MSQMNSSDPFCSHHPWTLQSIHPIGLDPGDKSAEYMAYCGSSRQGEPLHVFCSCETRQPKAVKQTGHSKHQLGNAFQTVLKAGSPGECDNVAGCALWPLNCHQLTKLYQYANYWPRLSDSWPFGEGLSKRVQVWGRVSSYTYHVCRILPGVLFRHQRRNYVQRDLMRQLYYARWEVEDVKDRLSEISTRACSLVAPATSSHCEAYSGRVAWSGCNRRGWKVACICMVCSANIANASKFQIVIFWNLPERIAAV